MLLLLLLFSRPAQHEHVSDHEDQDQWPFTKFFEAPVYDSGTNKYYKSFFHAPSATFYNGTLWVALGSGERMNLPFAGFAGTDEERRIAQLVNVANGICNNQGFTHGITKFHDTFKEGAWEELGLSLSHVDRIIEDVNRSMSQAMELMGYSGC